MTNEVSEFLNYEDKDREDNDKLSYSAFTINQLETLSAITSVAQGDLGYYELFEEFWEEVLDKVNDKISSAIYSSEHMRDSLMAQGESVKTNDYATALALTYNESDLLEKLVSSMEYETIETHLNHFVKSLEEWKDIDFKVKAMPVAWLVSHKDINFLNSYIELGEE
jgi:hypothetical protein